MKSTRQKLIYFLNQSIGLSGLLMTDFDWKVNNVIDHSVVYSKLLFYIWSA